MIVNMLWTPILVLPDFDKDFLLHTDTSATAKDCSTAILCWDRETQIISYCGRMLRKAEQLLDVKDRECLALVTVIKQFHVYLANQKFYVYTDLIALQYLTRKQESTGRLTWLAMYLKFFNFEIHYKSDKDNVCADFLSRIEHLENKHQRRPSIEVIVGNLAEHPSGTQSNSHTETVNKAQLSFKLKFRHYKP